MHQRHGGALLVAALCWLGAASASAGPSAAEIAIQRGDVVDSEDTYGKPVTDATAALSLTSSAFAVVVPSPITLTATISGATLAGNIVFTDGAAVLGSVAIKSSKAALTTGLGAGIHHLNASYSAAGVELNSALVVIVDNAPVCK